MQVPRVLALHYYLPLLVFDPPDERVGCDNSAPFVYIGSI